MNLKYPSILLLLLALVTSKLSAQNLPSKSRWEGQLTGLKIILRVIEDSVAKEKKAEIDIPQQMLLGLKINKLTVGNDSLTAFNMGLNFTLKGAFNKDKTELTGKWLQGGASLPFTLKQVPYEVARPQNPKAPFPYLAENVVYFNRDKSIQYGATLTLPKSAKPAPAVILITGSGLEDRDETLFDHKPFWVIADHLSRNSIAVLRVDDRGIGQTTGRDPNVTSADFAKDVMVGIEFLKKQAGIDAKNIGLLGHSEGGMIAPLVAVQSADVAFIVSLAGVGVKGRDILHKQKYDAYKKTGQFSEDELSRISALDDALVAVATKYTSDTEMGTDLQKAFTHWKAQQTENFLNKTGFIGPNAMTVIGKQVGAFYQPWLRYFIAYDPANTLGKLTIPVLALNGEKDVQVDAKTNLTGFSTLLTQAGNKNFKTMAMPGLNHMFQHATTGEVGEYGEIEETISPEVLDIITKWIKGLKPRK